MKTGMEGFWIFLLCNTVVSFIYFFVSWLLCFRQKKALQMETVLKFMVLLFCPGMGIFLFGITYVLKKTVYKNPVNLYDVIFSKERVKTYMYADEEQERNIVPLGDAITLSDTKSLRSLMMNVVRGDIQESLLAISGALNSEDSETSHYAAAVLQEALDSFRTRVQQGHQRVCKNTEEHVEQGIQLLEAMDPVIRQKIFAAIEQESMVRIMDDIAEAIYTYQPDCLKSSHIENITMRLLEIKEYDKCEKWCERAEYMFPRELATYTSQLKLYFTIGKKQKFFRVMQDLKNSDIVVDNETLELIRVFN